MCLGLQHAEIYNPRVAGEFRIGERGTVCALKINFNED